jgi:hypothetical protein
MIHRWVKVYGLRMKIHGEVASKLQLFLPSALGWIEWLAYPIISEERAFGSYWVGDCVGLNADLGVMAFAFAGSRTSIAKCDPYIMQ